MAIKLKNYTTEVPATRSIDAIERLLVGFGAFNIMKEYEDVKGLPCRRCTSISFIIEIEGLKRPIKLPANVQNVAAWLKRQHQTRSDKWIIEQAERIAWKQQAEILHLQLSQIETTQLEGMEVFIAYLFDVQSRQTFYQKLKASGFKQLGNG